MNAAFPIALASSAILSGTSLLYATLGELIGERAGIVNLGLEGHDAVTCGSRGRGGFIACTLELGITLLMCAHVL